MNRYAAPAIIFLHTALVGWAAIRQSPTDNEIAHVVAGIRYLKSGRADVYRVNPPLTHLVAGALVLAAHPVLDWNRFADGPGVRPEFQLAREFAAANGSRSLWFCTVARWACIPFSWVGALICFRWSKELYGTEAALLALLLWCFCPNVLAHAQLATPDIGATALGLAASYAFWHWLKAPTWHQSLLCGVLLGLAELTKFTWVILFALWPGLWLFRWLLTPFRRWDPRLWRAQVLQCALIIVVGLYVVNLMYGFKGTFRHLRTYQFVSESLTGHTAEDGVPVHQRIGNRFATSWTGAIPLPLPEDYLVGLDVQKADIEHHACLSYLRGAFRQHGWWYYYIYAAAIKTPLGTLILLLLSLLRRDSARVPTPSRSLDIPSGVHVLALLAPMVVVLAVVSSQTGLNRHFRYALPVLPYGMIWISRVAWVFQARNCVIRTLGRGACTWSVCSSLFIYPHSLAYFNEVVGGPNGGHAHLLDSNIDWGQDLIHLREWVASHPQAKPLRLAYCGLFDPHIIGLEYKIVSPDSCARGATSKAVMREAGWYAISVNFLRGNSGPITTEKGKARILETPQFTFFQTRQNDSQSGYSIYLYYLPAQ